MDELNGWLIHPSANLFPLVGDDELKVLADDIAHNGLHEPVWLYPDPNIEDEGGNPRLVLLDGRNRVRACLKAGVEIQTRIYEGDDPIGFSIAANTKRRHLTTGQKAAAAVAALEMYEAEAKQRVLAGRKLSGAEEDERMRRSSTRAALVVGTSGRAVERYKRVMGYSEKFAELVKSGEWSLDRAERVMKDQQSEARRSAQAQAEAGLSRDDLVEPTVLHGDFREVLAPGGAHAEAIEPGSVDLVFVDPNYSKEYVGHVREVARLAQGWLKPEGMLAVLVAPLWLPQVIQAIQQGSQEGDRARGINESMGRPYRWTMAWVTRNEGTLVYPRRMWNRWRAVLVYGGVVDLARKAKGRKTEGIITTRMEVANDFIVDNAMVGSGSAMDWDNDDGMPQQFIEQGGDVVQTVGLTESSKSWHRQGQNEEAMRQVVRELTKVGDLVLDPMCGGGTTLVAAWALGRRSIGCDLDEQAVKASKERVRQAIWGVQGEGDNRDR